MSGAGPEPWRVVVDPEPRERGAGFALRRRVFVDEQSVPLELEQDGLDDEARHAVVFDAAGRAIAAGRLLVRGDVAKYQRIAVDRGHRGRGAGRAVMAALDQVALGAGCRRARLSSQVDAIGFYLRLGYAVCSDVYMDAGIPHRDMERPLDQAPPPAPEPSASPPGDRPDA